MKAVTLVTAALLLAAIPIFGQTPPDTTQTPPAASTTSPETLGGAPLRVMVGKSLLINTTERLKRVSVTDPAVADALVVTPTQVLVNGLAPGEVSLLIWDELERSQSFDLRVDVDITAASEEIHKLFPDEKIDVTPSRSAIVLSGHVTTEDVAKHAGGFGLRLLEKRRQRSDLRTRRCRRSLIGGEVCGSRSHRPYPTRHQPVHHRSRKHDRQRRPPASSGGTTTSPLPTPRRHRHRTGNHRVTASPTRPASANVLNLFFFNLKCISVGHPGPAVRNLLQILAEPNLVAVNGKEASFLAGGEFPFPVVQPEPTGLSTVTIQFREFGVRLKFTPVVQPNGNIHLHVMPEVSTLDFTNAVTVSGTTIPALSTRKADSEFELQDGQSFVIAGLMDNRVTHIMIKIPWLGDIPILGNFFKSKSAQKSNSELMVLCTARRVSPIAANRELRRHQSLFGSEEFDSKK